MTITAEHAEAMRAGRDRKVAAEAEKRLIAHAEFTEWVRADAELWRGYIAATDAERAKAHDAWSANLKGMPSISWAASA